MTIEVATNLFIDGARNAYAGGADAYEKDVFSILKQVYGSTTGKAIISSLKTAAHRVTILPPGTDRSDEGDTGAGADDLVAATARGETVRGGRGAPDEAQRKGTGTGSDVHINFQPDHWRQNQTDTPELVILHEMFHALRQASGVQRNVPMAGDFLTEEELYCIFVQNMHATERNLSLRATHTKRSSNMTPRHRMQDNPSFHAPMRSIFSSMPTLCRTLAAIAIAYNPFSDWQQMSGQG